MEISMINFDIFSQKITPMETYRLIGDKNPQHEIKSIYFKKIVKKKIISDKKNTINNIQIPSLTTDVDHNEKENIDIEKKSKEQNININLNNTLISKDELDDLVSNHIELTQEQKNKFKLKDNDPFIYSFNTLHKLSIFYGTKYNKLFKNNELKLPLPNIIKKKDWCKAEDTSKETVLEGLKVIDELGIIIDSPELKIKFQGLVADIIFQLIRVPIGHHISLNIKIFEPNTVLSKYMKIFSYANTYLLQASNPNLIPYERFKLIIAFLFGGLFTGSKQLKPFNPFLGETFQGEFPNGAKIYVENASHRPLSARFLVIYQKKYEISGYWNLDVVTQGLGNEMVIYQKGPIKIKFPEINECYVGHIPFVKAINARSEEKRGMKLFGTLICVDPKNKYKSIIYFDQNKKIFHEIKGCTMEYSFPENYQFETDKEWKFGLEFKMEENMQVNHKKTKMNDDYKIIENISGSFINYLKIGDDILWDINKNIPEPITPVKNCLPSDGRYREDLIWLYRSFYGVEDEKEKDIYLNIGMKWKVMMEEFSRWERKNRADYNEFLKKQKKKKKL